MIGKRGSSLETIYADADVLVYKSRVYTYKDFVPEYWKRIYHAAKITARYTHPFKEKEDSLYRVKISSEELHSSDLYKYYGRNRKYDGMITIPFVPTKVVDNRCENDVVNLTFVGFTGYVSPEDRPYVDTARFNLHCKIHFTDDPSPI